MACVNNNDNSCPRNPCTLDNAIKDYKKSRGGINDPSLKPFLKIVDELRKNIDCASLSSSYSDYSLLSGTASYALNAGSSGVSGLITGSTYPITASHSLTASYFSGLIPNGLITGSTYPITSSYSITSSNSLTSSTVPFDGNRSITRNDPVWQGVNVGGTTVTEFLNNFFFPFVPATVTLSLIPSTTVYEIGNDPSPVIRVNVTANDETLFESGSVRKDGVNTWTITKPVLPATNYDNTDSNITTGHYYQAYVSASNNGTPGLVSSNTSTIYFVYPYFWGITATAGLSGTSLYTGLTKTIQREDTDQTISFTGTAVYIYYCFPDGQGYSDVSAIYDPNNFEVKSLFTKTIESVTSTGLTTDWTQNYVVYRLTLLSNPNGNYRFVH